MVSYCKPSSILFLASAISIASAHNLPKDFDVEKFAVELKQLRIRQYGSNSAANSRNTPKGFDSEKYPGKLKKLRKGQNALRVGQDTKSMKQDTGAFLEGHEFEAPDCTEDCRGPCPFINVMANHGFINRNGESIPIFEIPALAPDLFDFPKEMFTRPANQAIFDGQADVGSDGEPLLDIVRLWDRPGEERDISQVFPNPGLMWTEERLDKAPTEDFPEGQTEIFTDFRYTPDQELLQQLLALSEDGSTMTQAQHNQHLWNRIEDSYAHDEFFRLSEDDKTIAATQYVLPCIILGEDVEDFSFCPKSSIEGLWTDFRFPEGFEPRSMRFMDQPVQFNMGDYVRAFMEFRDNNRARIVQAVLEHAEEAEAEEAEAEAEPPSTSIKASVA